MPNRAYANRLSPLPAAPCEARLVLAADTMAFATTGPITTLPNGQTWYDTDGNKLDAHGSTFNKVGDYYYMFGTQRTRLDENGQEVKEYDNIFRAIKVYRSKDLVNWEFVRDAITLADMPDAEYVGTGSRPNVIYNQKTGKYVMFFKRKVLTPEKSELKLPAIATSNTIDGPYTFEKYYTPAAGNAGGMHLFQDDDGTAYLVYSETIGGNRSLRIDQLSDDYLNAVDSAKINTGDREGPAMFKANGQYYLVHSGTTGWTPNELKYQSATSPLGEWSRARTFGDHNGYRSQPNDILQIHGTEGTSYIYVGDRHDGNYLGDSTYVWLPIKFNTRNPNKISIDYYDSFNIDLNTGLWSE